MAVSIRAELREQGTKSDRKQLRSRGKIPAVVYGKKIDRLSVTVDEKELTSLLRHNPHALLEMEVPGKGNVPVMLSEIQRDKLSRAVLHVDFHQVNLDEPIRTAVPVELTGSSPGEAEGGLLSVLLHEVEVRCLPKHVPASIPLDVSGLGIGDSFLVGDLTAPAGVEIKSDPGAVLVTVLAPQKERPAEAAEVLEDRAGEAAREESGEPAAGKG